MAKAKKIQIWTANAYIFSKGNKSNPIRTRIAIFHRIAPILTLKLTATLIFLAEKVADRDTCYRQALSYPGRLLNHLPRPDCHCLRQHVNIDGRDGRHIGILVGCDGSVRPFANGRRSRIVYIP